MGNFLILLRKHIFSGDADVAQGYSQRRRHRTLGGVSEVGKQEIETKVLLIDDYRLATFQPVAVRTRFRYP